MQAELARDFLSVRRAYELGRIRTALLPALVVALAVLALGDLTSGRAALPWFPLTFAAWVFAYFRGHVFLRGALYGLAGGFVTSLLPLSILRPCCAVPAAPGVDCCTMPGACLAAGAVVGFMLATVVPFGRASWWRTALGVVLGTTSVAVMKCATLFAGESAGLLGGLLAGVAASMGARLALSRRFAP